MAGLLSRGLVLDQLKEPALSRDLREFTIPGSAAALPLPAVQDAAALSGDEVLEYARAAEIVDERDGVLLADKLEQARRQGVTLVAADAIDDEPFVSSQLNPLFKLSQQAVGGLTYAAKAARTENVQIAVYKNLYDVQMHIPNTLYGAKIKRITGKYPVEVREDFLRRGGNVLLCGVCALIHLYRAVNQGLRQTTSFITVAGNCVANPQNMEVTTGMSVMAVLERCGLFDEPARIVVGGPMTGTCVTEPETTLVRPTTRAVLAFKSDAAERNYHCIGCGKCTDVCPQNLSPVFLYKAAKTKHLRVLRLYDAQSCVGCGTCSYICPARLDLSAEIQKAAALVRALEGGGTVAADREEVGLPC